MYLDSHAHLEEQHFGSEVDAVLGRAREAGLAVVLAIGNGSRKSGGHREAQRLAARYDFVFATVGVHPHEAQESDARFLEELADLARSDARIVAWGEIGLDYHYDFSPRETQRAVFADQLKMARELDLPVVIHSREAEEDTLTLLRPWAREKPWGVLHCFTGSRRLAEEGLAMGLAISFSGILTFPKAGDLREIAGAVPSDRLLVESDCPYLAPVPHRGRRNEPAWVVSTFEKLAEIRGDAPAELQKQLLGNFSTLFNVNIDCLGR